MITCSLLAVVLTVLDVVPAAHADLVDEVRKAAAELTTLAFVAEVEEDTPKMAGRRAVKRTLRIQVQMADGAKFRVEGLQDGQPVGTIVSDGCQVAEWDPTAGVWTRYPMPDYDEEFALAPLIVDDHVLRRFADSWVDERGPFGPWMERLISQRDTEMLAPQAVEGRPCVVARHQRKELSFPYGAIEETNTFYFDRSTHLLARHAMTLSATNILLMSHKGSLDVRILDPRPDAKLAADAFVFAPPAGAEFIPPDDPRIRLALPPGEVAPDLQLQLVGGAKTALKDLIAGKVALVSFWATWCGPCIEEMPTLSNLHEEFTDRGLVIVGVSGDSAMSPVTAFQKKRPLPYVVALDVDHEQARRLYHFRAIPHTVLIDRDGRVVKTFQGWSRAQGDAEIRAMVEKLVGEHPAEAEP